MTEKEADVKVREVAGQVKALLGELDDTVARLRAILGGDGDPARPDGSGTQEAVSP